MGTIPIPSQYISLRKNSVLIQNKLTETPTHKNVQIMINQCVTKAKLDWSFASVFFPRKKGSAEYLNA